MLRRLYDWTLNLAAHRHAQWALFWVAFIESSFFPVPPDVVLIAMILAAPTRAWRYALICTVGSVLGGMLGYAIGYFLFESVGKPILEFYGAIEQFAQLQGLYQEWGFWLVLAKGLTPIPYKVVTIASGVFQLDLLAFTFGSILSRGLRFFLVAALLRRYGEPVRAFIEKRLGLLTAAMFALIVGGFVALRYVF